MRCWAGEPKPRALAAGVLAAGSRVCLSPPLPAGICPLGFESHGVSFQGGKTARLQGECLLHGSDFPGNGVPSRQSAEAPVGRKGPRPPPQTWARAAGEVMRLRLQSLRFLHPERRPRVLLRLPAGSRAAGLAGLCPLRQAPHSLAGDGGTWVQVPLCCSPNLLSPPLPEAAGASPASLPDPLETLPAGRSAHAPGGPCGWVWASASRSPAGSGSQPVGAVGPASRVGEGRAHPSGVVRAAP